MSRDNHPLRWIKLPGQSGLYLVYKANAIAVLNDGRDYQSGLKIDRVYRHKFGHGKRRVFLIKTTTSGASTSRRSLFLLRQHAASPYFWRKQERIRTAAVLLLLLLKTCVKIKRFQQNFVSFLFKKSSDLLGGLRTTTARVHSLSGARINSSWLVYNYYRVLLLREKVRAAAALLYVCVFKMTRPHDGSTFLFQTEAEQSNRGLPQLLFILGNSRGKRNVFFFS